MRLMRYAAAVAVCLLFSVLSHARINIIEPWYPGIDTRIAPLHSYRYDASFRAGEYLYEVPFQLTYAAESRLEVGGRWGIENFHGITGINDLLLGLKYQFMEGGDQVPFVIGEAAISLPTADTAHNLGTGSASLLLNWAMEQRVQKYTGYLGFGIRLNSENSKHDQQGNVFSYRAGASYPYSDFLRLYGELKGFNHGSSKVAGINTDNGGQELYLAPGAQYRLDAYHTLSGALLIGLTPESNDLGLFASINF